MPIYEYRCRDCGQISEFFFRTSSGSENRSCPHCGSLNLEKIISAPALLKDNPNTPGYTCCGRTERCDTPPCSTNQGCRQH